MSQVKLNLGCNVHPEPGFVNVDMRQFPGVDVVCDLNEKWPWEDGSVAFIKAWDVVEHLKSPPHTMNEAWRVLIPADGLCACCDPAVDADQPLDESHQLGENGTCLCCDPPVRLMHIPRGSIDILVPSTDGRGAFQDPTHISFWNANSFLYYSAVNPEHHLLYPDLIKCAYKIRIGQTDMNDIGVTHVRALCTKVPWPPQS